MSTSTKAHIGTGIIVCSFILAVHGGPDSRLQTFSFIAIFATIIWLLFSKPDNDIPSTSEVKQYVRNRLKIMNRYGVTCYTRLPKEGRAEVDALDKAHYDRYKR